MQRVKQGRVEEAFEEGQVSHRAVESVVVVAAANLPKLRLFRLRLVKLSTFTET
jgi:hypothetical protein